MFRTGVHMPTAIAVFLCILAPTADWAHGPGESDTFVLDPAKPSQKNEALLPRSLPLDARGPASAVMDQMKMWGDGQHVAVCFVDPVPPEMQTRIANAANQWTTWANLSFDIDAACDPQKTYDITVAFKAGRGSWSYIGTDSRDHNPSMNLDNMDDPRLPVAHDEREYNRIVMHEFGHAIGLDHEHQSPEAHCGDEIDWQKADAYYEDPRHGGWTEQQVQDNLQTIVIIPGMRAAKDALKISGFDKHSIMMYSLPAQIFKDGIQASCYTTTNYDLSPLDEQWAAGLYPKQADQQVAVKRAVLTTLGNSFKQNGVPDDERAAAIENIGKTFGLTIEQVNNAGRDIINTTTQQNSSGTGASNQSSSGAGAINQSSTGAGAINFGTNSGTVNLYQPPKQ